MKSCIALLCATWLVAPALSASLVIRDVTVIDPQTEQVLPHRDVYIDGDRIVSIGTRAERRDVPRQILEGKGQFLVPGFMDMHAHVGLLKKYELFRYSSELFIVHGVTALRDPMGDCFDPVRDVCLPELRAWNRQVEAGEKVGPRLVSLSSAKVWGPELRKSLPAGSPAFYAPATEEEGRELARFLQQRGVDSVKTSHEIHPDAYRGLTAEARHLHLEVSGHPPYAFTLKEAADLGHRVFDHFIYLAPDCSRGGPAWHQRNYALLSQSRGREHPAADMLIGQFDPELCRQVMAELAQRDVYVTTSLLAFTWLFTQDIEAQRSWVSPGQYESWRQQVRDIPPAASNEQRRMLDHTLGLMRIARDANVKLMLGTDTHAAGMVAGSSVHEEMALLRRAGLSPMEILRSATTVPAQYLNREKTFGGVSAGKVADLVLLERNPLEEIANTRAISAVILGGRVFDRAAIEALKRNVQSQVLQ